MKEQLKQHAKRLERLEEALTALYARVALDRHPVARQLRYAPVYRGGFVRAATAVHQIRGERVTVPLADMVRIERAGK